MINTLTTALARFAEAEVRPIAINKAHTDNFHIYYRKDGLMRVLMLPKRSDNLEKVSTEVGILLDRDNEKQKKVGYLDRT